MAEGKLCGVCGKNAATEVCSECGVPLCDECCREVSIPELGLGYQLKGQSTSPLRRGTDIKKVCEKCLQEVDYL